MISRRRWGYFRICLRCRHCYGNPGCHYIALCSSSWCRLYETVNSRCVAWRWLLWGQVLHRWFTLFKGQQCHSATVPRGANAAQVRQVRFIGSVEQSARDLGSRWFQRLWVVDSWIPKIPAILRHRPSPPLPLMVSWALASRTWDSNGFHWFHASPLPDGIGFIHWVTGMRMRKGPVHGAWLQHPRWHVSATCPDCWDVCGTTRNQWFRDKDAHGCDTLSCPNSKLILSTQ